MLPEVPSPWGSHAILLDADRRQGVLDRHDGLAGRRGISCRAATAIGRSTSPSDAELKLMKTPTFTYKDYRIEQITHVHDPARRHGPLQARIDVSRLERLVAPRQVARSAARRTPPLRDCRVAGRPQQGEAASPSRSTRSDSRFRQAGRAEMEFEVPEAIRRRIDRDGSFSDSPVWTWLLGYNLDLERTLAVPACRRSSSRSIATSCSAPRPSA